jgi:hypothetical protein
MLSTPFEFQIVLTPKPMHHTESTTLVLSLPKFPRTAVLFDKESLQDVLEEVDRPTLGRRAPFRNQDSESRVMATPIAISEE